MARRIYDPLKRLDRPTHLIGTYIELDGGEYIIESIEIQESDWCAMLVRYEDVDKAEARCWAIPVWKLGV